jgi:imidazolonepropionase-like amidohydrolase
MPPWDSANVTTLAKTPPSEGSVAAIRLEVNNYRRLMEAGATVALGTDAPLVPIGLHVHLGLRALHQYAGLSIVDTLRSATVVPAKLFGVDGDLGTVRPGKLADLTVIDGDPFTTFTDLVRVSWVMRDGHIFHRSDLVKQAHALTPEHAAVDWHAVGEKIRSEGCCS